MVCFSRTLTTDGYAASIGIEWWFRDFEIVELDFLLKCAPQYAGLRNENVGTRIKEARILRSIIAWFSAFKIPEVWIAFDILFLIYKTFLLPPSHLLFICFSLSLVFVKTVDKIELKAELGVPFLVLTLHFSAPPTGTTQRKEGKWYCSLNFFLSYNILSRIAIPTS